MRKPSLIAMFLLGVLLLVLSQSDAFVGTVASRFGSFGLSAKTALMLAGGFISGITAFLLTFSLPEFIADFSERKAEWENLKYRKKLAEERAAQEAEEKRRAEELRKQTAAATANRNRNK